MRRAEVGDEPRAVGDGIRGVRELRKGNARNPWYVIYFGLIVI